GLARDPRPRHRRRHDRARGRRQDTDGPRSGPRRTHPERPHGMSPEASHAEWAESASGAVSYSDVTTDKGGRHMSTYHPPETRARSRTRWIVATAIVLAIVAAVVLIVVYAGGGGSGGGY